jgi:hypothetical protein
VLSTAYPREPSFLVAEEPESSTWSITSDRFHMHWRPVDFCTS